MQRPIDALSRVLYSYNRAKPTTLKRVKIFPKFHFLLNMSCTNSLFCNILWYLIKVWLSLLQYIWLRYTWFDHVIFIRFVFRRRQAILRSFHCPIGRWYWKYKTIYFHKIRHIIEFTRINWISLRETFLTHQLHTRTHFHIGSKTLGCHVTITDFEPTLTRS